MTGRRGPREAAVAGIFYPAEPEELRRKVVSLLAEAGDIETEDNGARDVVQAIIAPHAGYTYCGPVVAAAYRTVLPLRGKVNRIVIIGPAHHGEFEGIALPSASYFKTPLCTLPVDLSAVKTLTGLPQVVVRDDAHDTEHSIEVQLPFIIMTLGIVPIVPLIVGGADDKEIAELLKTLWDDTTLVVASTELSRYRDDETARQMDMLTAKYIRLLEVERIGKKEACGYRVLRGVLYEARRRSLHVSELMLGNSTEASGDPNSVVGYGAFAIRG